MTFKVVDSTTKESIFAFSSNAKVSRGEFVSNDSEQKVYVVRDAISIIKRRGSFNVLDHVVLMVEEV